MPTYLRKGPWPLWLTGSRGLLAWCQLCVPWDVRVFGGHLALFGPHSLHSFHPTSSRHYSCRSPRLFGPTVPAQQPVHMDGNRILGSPYQPVGNSNPLMMEGFQNPGWSLISKDNRGSKRRPGAWPRLAHG